MNASLKTALFFTFAAVALAATHADVALLKKSGRHPFWSGITQLDLSAEEVAQERARMINSALALPSVHTTGDNANLWIKILTGESPYPFEEGEKGLTTEAVKQQIIALVDPLIDEPSSDFEAAKLAVISKAERLVKMQLLNSAFDLANKDAKSQLELKKEMITEAINHINIKVSSMSVTEGSPVFTVATELTEALTALKENIHDHYFPEAILLLALLRNKLVYLTETIKDLLDLPASEAGISVSDEDFLFKFHSAINFFGAYAKALGKSDQFVLVFQNKIQTVYAKASKSGSSVGSPRFRQLVPRMVGQYLAAITKYADEVTAYQMAHNYLRLVTTTNMDRASVLSLLKNFVLAGKLPQPIIGGDDRTFVVNSLKIINLVKNLPVGVAKTEADKKLEGDLLNWWVQIADSMEWVLEQVNGETIDRLNLVHNVLNELFGLYPDNPEYFDGLYNLLIGLAIDNEVSHADKSRYSLNVLEYVQNVFGRILKGDIEYSEENEFISKHYVHLIFHLLRSRPNDEGTVQFLNFNQGLFATQHLEAAKKITEKQIKTLYITFSNAFNKQTGLKTTEKIKKDDMSKPEFLLRFAGQTFPFFFFSKEQIGVTENTQETVKANAQAEKKVDINFKTSDGDLAKIEKKPKAPKIEEPIQVIHEVKEEDKKEEDKKEDVVPENNEQPNKEAEVIAPKQKDPVTFLDEPSKDPHQIVSEELKTPTVDTNLPEEKNEEPIQEDTKKEEDLPLPEIKENPSITSDLPKDEEKKSEDEEEHHIDEKSPEETEEPKEEPKPKEESQNVKTLDEGIHSTDNNKIIPIPLVDVHEGAEMEGDEIDLTPTVIEKRFSNPQEIKNLIEVMKGQFDDPEQLKKLEEADDLVDVVMKLEIVEHPNGDRTEYYYLQLVEKGTGCHSAIID